MKQAMPPKEVVAKLSSVEGKRVVRAVVPSVHYLDDNQDPHPNESPPPWTVLELEVGNCVPPVKRETVVIEFDPDGETLKVSSNSAHLWRIAAARGVCKMVYRVEDLRGRNQLHGIVGSRISAVRFVVFADEKDRATGVAFELDIGHTLHCVPGIDGDVVVVTDLKEAWFGAKVQLAKLH